MKNVIFVLMAILLIASATALIGHVYSDDGMLYITLDNPHGYKMKDVRVTAYLNDDYMVTYRDVKGHETATAVLMTDVDEPGFYPVRISASNDDFREVKYTWVWVE